LVCFGPGGLSKATSRKSCAGASSFDSVIHLRLASSHHFASVFLL
jgi:hypothetical protein